MEIKLEGNKLIIEAIVSSGVPSKSEKTLVVASTNGFVEVPGTNLKVSLNVVKPRR